MLSCLGLPGRVTMTSVLEAKFAGVWASRPALAALVMLLASAEANTSAFAPCVNCSTRDDEPAKLNCTSAPGLSFW